MKSYYLEVKVGDKRHVVAGAPDLQLLSLNLEIEGRLGPDTVEPTTKRVWYAYLSVVGHRFERIDDDHKISMNYWMHYLPIYEDEMVEVRFLEEVEPTEPETVYTLDSRASSESDDRKGGSSSSRVESPKPEYQPCNFKRNSHIGLQFAINDEDFRIAADSSLHKLSLELGTAHDIERASSVYVSIYGKRSIEDETAPQDNRQPLNLQWLNIEKLQDKDLLRFKVVDTREGHRPIQKW